MKKKHDRLSMLYDKQRRSFIADLILFNEKRRTPFIHVPKIAGRDIDLYHLYQKVTGFGGWQKVNNSEKWENFQEEFGLPTGCVNSAQALKNIYFRYLSFYEKVNFLGEDPDSKNDDDDEGPVRKKICLPVETIPLYYNYNQHKLTDAQRAQYSLSSPMCNQSKYDKLALSLCSGLPNEVDLAVSVCVLLSTEGRHCMKLENSSQLLRLLLAHVAIFDQNSDDMQDLYQHCWTHYTNRNFLKFWFETVNRSDIRSLLIWRGHQYVQRELLGSDVLNLGRDAGILDIEGQRVLQIAVVLHNLSFEDTNQKILASSHLVYKFLLLSFYSTYGGLRQLALDTLANISCELALDACLDSQLVLDLFNCALFSEDRFFVVRGLEILSKLCQLTCNESILLSNLRDEVYKRLVALLTVQDIQLIVHTLEALYKLSKVGEPFTTKLAHVHRAVDTLVSLTTIKAQSFGPASLVGIKVMEYVPPAYVTAEGGDNVRRATTVIQPVNPDTVNIYQVPANSQSQLGVVSNTGGSGVGSSTGGQVPSGSASFTKQKLVPDIRTTSANWLNATYDLKKRSKVNQVKLFSDYLQFCRSFGIKTALSSTDFLHLVKVIFHNCDVLSIKRKNGDRHVYLEGLCKRSTQQPFAVAFLSPEKGYGLSSPVQQDTCRNNSQGSFSSTPAGPGKPVTGKHTRAIKNVKSQPSTSARSKQILLVTKSSGNACNILNQSDTSTNQLLSYRLKLTPGKSSPLQTLAGQTDKANKTNIVHLYSVKSLLAQKLSKSMPEKGGFSSSLGPSSGVSNISHCSQSRLVVTSSPTSTVVTSSHSSISQQQHPPTVSCMVPTNPSSNNILAKPSALTSNTNLGHIANRNHQSSQQCHQNHTSLSDTTIDSFVIANSKDVGLAQQSTNQNPTTIAHKKQHPLLNKKQTVRDNIAQHEHNSKVPVSKQITVTHCVSQNCNISLETQRNCTAETRLLSLSSIKPSLENIQQKTFVKLPKAVDSGHQCNNFVPQRLSNQVIHITGSHSPGNLSLECAAKLQIASSASSYNIVSAVTAQNTTVTWPLSSPSVISQNSTVIQSSPAVISQSSTVTQSSSPSVISQSSTVMQSSSPSLIPQNSKVTQSSSSLAVTAELTIRTQQGPQIKTSPPVILCQTQHILSDQVPTNGVNHAPAVPGNGKVSPQSQNLITSTSDTCKSPWQWQQTIVTHPNHNSSPSFGITTYSSYCHPSSSSPNSDVTTNVSKCVPSFTSQPTTESRTVRPGLHFHDHHPEISDQVLNISPPVEVESQTHLYHQQTVLPNQCNGFSHEVNSILDSPESIGTDFPASPLSSGLSSDIDYPDERFMQMKSILFKTNDSNVENYLKESTKNGYVFPNEGNHCSLQQVCTEPHKMSAQSNGLIAVPEVSVGSGCFSDVMQSSDSLDKAANINSHQGDIKCSVYSSSNVLHKVELKQSSHNLGMQEELADIDHQQLTANIHQNQEVRFVPQHLKAHQLQHHQAQQQHNLITHEQPQKQMQQQKHTHSQQIIQHESKYKEPQSSSSSQMLSGCLQHSMQSYPGQASSKSTGSQNDQSFSITMNALPGTDNSISSPTAEKTQQNRQSLQAQITYKRKSKELKLDAQSLSKKTAVLQSGKRSTKEACSMQSVTQKCVTATIEYTCQWENCRRCFSSARLVFLHVYKQHLPQSAESSCQWASCEKLVRKRWSLVSHIQNHHCSEKAMQVVCQTEPVCTQQQKNGPSSASAPDSPPTATYSSEAAVKAVGRFSVRRPFPELTDEREGPVSKHIHLMAALILRNICHFSAFGRRLIKRHEQVLSYSTMSDVEASSALSQCLWDITQFCDQKQSPLIS